MKLLKALVVVLALCVVAFVAFAEEGKAKEQHWYEVDIMRPTYYGYICTLPYAETELKEILAKTNDFVLLDNLVYRDQSGKYKEWKEWDATQVGRVYVNVKCIISVQPLAGDPRKIVTAAAK
jgi:hypothetical protein